MLMKRRGKKIRWLAVVFAALLFCLTGCFGDASDKEKEKETDTRGRYLETEVKLPDHTKVFDMVKGTDGVIRIAVQDPGEGLAVWEMKEKGDTWEKVYNIEIDLTGYVTCANLASIALSPEGGAAVLAYLERADKNVDIKYFYVSNTGEVSASPYQSDPSELVSQLNYTSQGDFYLQAGFRVIKVDLKTGDAGEIVESSLQTSYYGTAGSRLYAVDWKGKVTEYDLESGLVAAPDKGLASAIEQSGLELGDRQGNADAAPVIFYGGEDPDTLFFCGDTGVYCHIKDGNIAEKIIDGGLTSLGSPDMEFKAMEMTGDSEFYILATGDDGDKLLKYTYDPEVSTIPEKELKVYSLYEDGDFRKAITQYQKNHPNLYIRYEVGLEADSQKTVSDVLRILNTEIMAGKGPDLLLLDGTPLDAYIEKGILEDITGIVKKVDDSEGLYTNITSGLARDSKLYAVPLRFSVPVAEATDDSLERIIDLKTLADEAERLRDEYPDQTIISEKNSGRFMAAQLYDACSSSWLNEEGGVNTERLADFYLQVKRLHRVDSHEEDTLYDGDTVEYMEYITNITGDLLMPYSGASFLNFGNIRDPEGVAMLAKARQETGTVGYKPFSGENGNAYLPVSIAGVNAKGSETELAVSFLEFLLKDTAQGYSGNTGLPVNKKAMARLLEADNFAEDIRGAEDPRNPGETITMYLENLDQGELDAFIKEAENFAAPALTDERIRQAVLEQANSCTEGTITPEEAAEKAADTVKLYLAER